MIKTIEIQKALRRRRMYLVERNEMIREKIKRVLEKEYGWSNLDLVDDNGLYNQLIKDTLKVIKTN